MELIHNSPIPRGVVYNVSGYLSVFGGLFGEWILEKGLSVLIDSE
jgi:hypothetical protein